MTEPFKVKTGIVVSTNVLTTNGSNVGIGTGTPNAPLSVNGAANVSANLTIGDTIKIGSATINSTTITIPSGILGTLTVQGDLLVNGAVTSSNTPASYTAYSSNATANSTVYLTTSNGTAGIEVGGTNAAYIDLKAPNSDDYDIRIVHWSNGLSEFITTNTLNFGISGTMSVTSANVNFDSDTLVIDTLNNRVGVGTATPAAQSKFEVAGQVKTISIETQGDGGFIGFGSYYNGSEWRTRAATNGAIIRQGGSNLEFYNATSNGSANGTATITQYFDGTILGSRFFSNVAIKSTNGRLEIDTNGASQSGALQFRDNGTLRWQWTKFTDNNLYLGRYDSGGVYIDNALQMNVSSGGMILANTLYAGGPVNFNSTLSVANTSAFTGSATFANTMSVTGTITSSGIIESTVGEIRVSTAGAPRIRFDDSAVTVGRYWWNYLDGDDYYILRDATDDGVWDAPHPFRLNGATGIAYLFGNIAWHAGNDGAGSGLDADLLDGQQGSYYSNATNISAGTLNASRLPTTFTQAHTFNSSSLTFGTSSGASDCTFTFQNAGNARWRFLQYNLDSGFYIQRHSNTGVYVDNPFYVNHTTGGITISNTLAVGVSATVGGGTVWHSGNDGAGSTLDADTLDGQQGAYYTNATNISTGTLADARLPTTMSGKAFSSDSSVTGNFTVASGDLFTYRSGGTTGVLFLNSAGTRYVYYDGTNYNMPGAGLILNGGTVWHSGNDGAGSTLDADTLDTYQASDLRKTLIHTQSMTGAASFAFNCTGYNELEIVMVGISEAAGNEMFIRLSADGSSYASTGYVGGVGSIDGSPSNASVTQGFRWTIESAAASTWDGVVSIYGFAENARTSYRGTVVDSTGRGALSSGVYNTARVDTHIQIITGSGANFDAGTVYIYGRK
jgi:hypothetical protein